MKSRTPPTSKRLKDQTEKWLIQQMWICRREINLYKTDAYKSNPTRYEAASYMKHCMEDYSLELKRHRERACA